MASIQRRGDWFHLNFRYNGRQYSHALKTKDRREAEALRGTVDRLLIRIRNKEFPPPPPNADVAQYLLSGGDIEVADVAVQEIPTLRRLTEQYIAAHSNGALEENSLTTVRLHVKHIMEFLGDTILASEVTPRTLQKYLDARSRKKGKKSRPISPETLKKEMATLRACWNWGIRAELVSGNFPGRSLTYPKTDEKLPFQTREEIERKIARGGLSKEEIDALWACLFLTKKDLAELIELAKAYTGEPFLYPMLVFAAHTGARRSEMMRMRIDDLDLEASFARIREKKRVKGQRSTRRVLPRPPQQTMTVTPPRPATPTGPAELRDFGPIPRRG